MLLQFTFAWRHVSFPLFQVTQIMSRRKRKADDLLNLAANLGPEDGSDPREFHNKPWNAPKKASRKGQQLCGQVKDALNTALPACADSLLQGLMVITVEPAPHTGRLLVVVSSSADVERTTITQALARATGFLRGEVAATISRRYTPELVFEIIGS
jgi:ribosome-binding factor A